MKKYFIYWISIFLLLACNKGPKDLENKTASGGTKEPERITLRFGMNDSVDSITYQSVVVFKDKLLEYTAGLVNMEIFPANQLGDYRAMAEQAIAGELDMMMMGYPDMSYMIPKLKVIGEPYVIKDFEHLERVLESEYGKEMEASLSNLGLKLLSVGYYRTRQTTSNIPINSMADMKGLKLRTPNVDFLIDYAKAVGANAAPIAFQELYLALQTNQVDAQENPLPTIDAMKFYEVQKYIALTNHFVASQAYIISNIIWKKLDLEQQNAVVRAAKDSATFITDKVKEQELSLIDFFKEKGIQFTSPDTQVFRDAMKLL